MALSSRPIPSCQAVREPCHDDAEADEPRPASIDLGVLEFVASAPNSSRHRYSFCGLDPQGIRWIRNLLRSLAARAGRCWVSRPLDQRDRGMSFDPAYTSFLGLVPA
jgi:hypothetical protein